MRSVAWGLCALGFVLVTGAAVSAQYYEAESYRASRQAVCRPWAPDGFDGYGGPRAGEYSPGGPRDQVSDLVDVSMFQPGFEGRFAPPRGDYSRHCDRARRPAPWQFNVMFQPRPRGHWHYCPDDHWDAF